MDGIEAGNRRVMLSHVMAVEINEVDGTVQWDTEFGEGALSKAEDEIWVDIGCAHDTGGDFIDGKISAVA